VTTLADVVEGRARWCVLEGDCLEVLATLPAKSGVVITDIPYGVGKQIKGDKQPWEQWLPWVDARLAECVRVGRLAFTFFAATRLIRFVRETTVPPQFEINWHKPMMLHDTSLNGSPFLAHRESILYWGPTSPKEAGKLGYDSVACNAMWPRERRAEGIEHPTPKPVELLCRSIPYWTKPDDIIIDPFCGSGTHLVAALRTGHRCIGIDIDPQWVAEATGRMLAEEQNLSLRQVADGQGALFAGPEDHRA
jgi:DNA modification methylase